MTLDSFLNRLEAIKSLAKAGDIRMTKVIMAETYYNLKEEDIVELNTEEFKQEE